MSFKPFPIVPIASGLERDKQPFLLPDDAFPDLTNCFLYQGRIERRKGNKYLGRLVEETRALDIGAFAGSPTTLTIPGVGLGIDPGSVTATIALPWTYVDNGLGRLLSPNTFTITAISNAVQALVTAVGHNIVIGDTVYILDVVGMTGIIGGPYTVVAPVVPAVSFTINFDTSALTAYTSGGITTRSYATINYVNGACVFFHNAIVAPNVFATFSLYNANRPCMGLPLEETGNINEEELKAFDTVKANLYSNAQERFIDISYYKMTPVAPALSNVVAWTGTDHDFFWTLNYYHSAGNDLFWATNNVPGKHGYPITAIANNGGFLQITVVGHTFIPGDVIFLNEITADTTRSGLTGTVTGVAGALVTLTTAYLAGAGASGGVAFALSQNIGPGDGIRFFDGYGAGLGWSNFSPPLSMNYSAVPDRYLFGSLILVSYRNRLVALNTTEGTFAGALETHQQRARWCWSGTPLYTETTIYTPAPTTVPRGGSNWIDTTPGFGGYIDAATSEQIVSCGFYKDTLIVFFERSTWQLFYTGNDALPFAWQRINSRYGAESTFSTVNFDKGLFAVGNVAIVTSDSVNVDRIDLKIPVEVFNFHNQNHGPERVHGIRDFFYDFVYWTFPNNAQNGTFPNRVLALNYQDGAYSFFRDSYTCFGYYQAFSDATWATSTFTWQEADPRTWEWAVDQSRFPLLVGGNQQGFVSTLNRDVTNEESLYITNITVANPAVVTSQDHNLSDGDFVKFSGLTNMVEINGLVGLVKYLSPTTFGVDIDSTGFTPYGAFGSGYLTVINIPNITTKKFNPFYQQGKKVRASYGDFFVTKTTNGEFTVDVLIDEDYSSPVVSYTVSTTRNYGPSIVSVNKVWQRMYADVMGQFLQLKISLIDAQIRDPVTLLETNPVQSDIVIHAINMWMAPSGRLQSYDVGV